MIELFRERDLTQVTYYQSLLEAAGISTFVRNENLSTTEGVSIPDFFPALCIVNDEDRHAAAEIIRDHLKESASTPPPDITCGTCGEISPGNFGACWNCQTPFA